MTLARPEASPRALALVEADDAIRGCVGRVLEGGQFQVVRQCGSAAELCQHSSSGSEFATIILGNDEDVAASRPEVERLRERFPDHTIINVSLRKACHGILQARNESDSARAAASFARALEIVLLEQREQSSPVGRLEAASRPEPADVRSHVKALLKRIKTSD